MQSYNLYCDESCHLEHDGINVMGLGSVWCDKSKIHMINDQIRKIKAAYNVAAESEVKWVRVGPVKRQLYIDLVNFFFDCEALHFRGLLIPDKSKLQHEKYNQDHEDWYYKMYFLMLKTIFSPKDKYNVFIDIKDNHSTERARKLHEVCCNDIYDFSHSIIRKVQPIRSEEVQIMQITDILLGAIVYANRTFDIDHVQSKTKLALIERIKQRSGYSLKKSTLFREDKLNLFVWRADFHDM